MKLVYNSFIKENIKEEIEKINFADEVDVRISTTDKGLLFLLGILFAAGKKINIINKEELELNTSKKSFFIMSYVWEKIGDENFPDKEHKNVITELDALIENTKRLGVKVEPIVNNPIDNKMFLICPVRNASKEQLLEMGKYVLKMKKSGYQVHAPHLDTVQKDMFGGYAICNQNANAISTSREIHIYYDKTSKGSMFDLGVAYYLDKPLKILNNNRVIYDENDFGDYVIKNWNYQPKIKIKAMN